MYLNRIRTANYGPIEALDCSLPFDDDNPKPLVLVGANGSGKSLFISLVVNGLLSTQAAAYPDSPEVALGKVYKVRTPKYITTGKEWSFTQVEFQNSPPSIELILSRRKQDFEQQPAELSDADAMNYYNKLSADLSSAYEHPLTQHQALELMSKNCAIYFPPNRFEDPAWLNVENLNTKAAYLDLKHTVGHSDRQIINYSPLRKNQDWLFGVIYDFSVFERHDTTLPIALDDKQGVSTVNIPVSLQIQGSAKKLYDAARTVIGNTLQVEGQFGLAIGRRQNRTVSILDEGSVKVHSVFQLSAGEVALLNLFISILRDFDLSGAEFTSLEEISGVVVVDEIDLHLHAMQQHDVLPRLMNMFPKIQFIVTTHSPLFVLGLQKFYGEDGFEICLLPDGVRINPEEFSEFDSAYRSFMATQRYSVEINKVVQQAQKPLLFVEGETDKKYLKAAMSKLSFVKLASDTEIHDIGDGGGWRNLNKAWNGLKNIRGINQPILLLYDCDVKDISADSLRKFNASLFKRKIERINGHPIQKGIENLFTRDTLDRARAENSAFINVEREHKGTFDGECKTIAEKWTINCKQKTNLCNWLCKNGKVDDFQHFRPVLKMLETTLFSHPDEAST